METGARRGGAATKKGRGMLEANALAGEVPKPIASSSLS